MGLLPLRSAVDTPRPAVLGLVEGMLRSGRNKHTPLLPHSILQLCPWEPKGQVRVWKRFPHTRPLSHTGKRRAEDQAPDQEPGWTRPARDQGHRGLQGGRPGANVEPRLRGFPGGPAIKTLRSWCSGHGFNPLAGDLLIRPHNLHQAAQARVCKKPQEPAGSYQVRKLSSRPERVG